MVNVSFSHKGKLAIFGSIDCFFTPIRGWDSVPITIMNENNCTQETARSFVSLESLDKT